MFSEDSLTPTMGVWQVLLKRPLRVTRQGRGLRRTHEAEPREADGSPGVESMPRENPGHDNFVSARFSGRQKMVAKKPKLPSETNLGQNGD